MENIENFDEKIREYLLAGNSLREQVIQARNGIAAKEAEILTAEDDETLEQLFVELEEFRGEVRRKLLLARRADLAHAQAISDKIQFQIEQKRTEWTNLLDEIPGIEAILKESQAEYDKLEEAIRTKSSQLSSLERQFVESQKQLGIILREPPQIPE